MANKIINKALSSVVFSNYPQLTIQPVDMAEEMCSLSYDDEPAERIKGAMGTILSPNFYIDATISVKILATSPQYKALKDQLQDTTILDGNVIFTDHAGEKISLSRITFKLNEIPADGKQAHIEATFTGNYLVNGGMI